MEFIETIDFKNIQQYFYNFAAFASILSFIISIFVLLSVRRIRNFYIFNARVPEINEELSKLASDLSGSLDSFDGLNSRIHKILVDLEISLKSLKKKVPKDIKRDIDSLISTIQITDQSRKNILLFWSRSETIGSSIESQREYLEKLHLSTYKVIAQCKSNHEESRWER